MLGKRFVKNFVSDTNKWKKSYAKIKLVGKKYSFINKNNFFDLYKKIIFSRKKTRIYYLKNLNKKVLFKDYKLNLILQNLKIYSFKINPFIFLFKHFSVGRLICLEYGKMEDYHLEMVRKTIKNFISKKSLIFLRLKPYLIMLKRSAQSRMGGGKASKIDLVYYPVFPGCIILDIYGVTYSSAFNVFKSLKSKLPVNIKLFFLK